MASIAPRIVGPVPVAALACVVALGFFWGTTSLAGKWAMSHGAPPVGYALWQGLIATSILAGICWFRGTWPPIDWAHGRYYLLGGILGLAIPNTNTYTVLQHVPAGIAVIVMTVSPLITYCLVLAMRMERFHPSRILGIVAGLAGALMLLLPKGSLPTPDMAPWVALMFLTPFCYASSNVLMGRHMPHSTDRLALSLGMVLAADLGLAIATLIDGSFFWPRLPPGPVEYAVLWHGMSTAASFVIYVTALRLAGPVYVSQVGYLTVLVGMTGAVWLFGERHSEWVWAALASIVAGLALVNLGQRRAARQAAR
ncbi:MAG: DMT family transporter [Alphaproteobacteria bacterium]|nr:DMT family transporter [Alphaproteobacteria bacterium]